MANPFQAVQLQCRSNVETYGAQGRIQEVSLVTFLTVMFNLVADVVYAWLDPRIRYE